MIIDPAVAQMVPYLTVFHVKDSPVDNVSCIINETNPSTELFYLQLNNIGMTTSLKNGRMKSRESLENLDRILENITKRQ